MGALPKRKLSRRRGRLREQDWKRKKSVVAKSKKSQLLNIERKTT